MFIPYESLLIPFINHCNPHIWPFNPSAHWIKTSWFLTAGYGQITLAWLLRKVQIANVMRHPCEVWPARGSGEQGLWGAGAGVGPWCGALGVTGTAWRRIFLVVKPRTVTRCTNWIRWFFLTKIFPISNEASQLVEKRSNFRGAYLTHRLFKQPCRLEPCCAQAALMFNEVLPAC